MSICIDNVQSPTNRVAWYGQLNGGWKNEAWWHLCHYL